MLSCEAGIGVGLGSVISLSASSGFGQELLDGFGGLSAFANPIFDRGEIVLGRVGSYCGSLRYCDSDVWVTDVGAGTLLGIDADSNRRAGTALRPGSAATAGGV